MSITSPSTAGAQPFTPGVHRRGPPGAAGHKRSVVIDETCVKRAGGWTYLYRAADQHGQVIDVLGSGATMAPQQRGRESDEHGAVEKLRLRK